MTSITMTSKGQITLPAATRTRLRLAKGARMDVDETADGRVVLTPVRPAQGGLAGLYGVFAHQGRPVSLDDMDRAIGEVVSERAQRRS